MNQRGNILFLILLAVVLFAALSYAVTQCMRCGGGDSSSENASLQASELMNYFVQIDTAIQRMMVINGVKDYELNFYQDFDHNYTLGANDNPNCTDDRCRVFDENGGVVKGLRLEPYLRPTVSIFNPERIFYISVPNVGTSAPDVIFTTMAVSKNLCKAINKSWGYDDIIYNVNIPDNVNTNPYVNGFTTGSIPDLSQSITGTLPGLATSNGTFCICSQSTWSACESTNYYVRIVHILLER